MCYVLWGVECVGFQAFACRQRGKRILVKQKCISAKWFTIILMDFDSRQRFFTNIVGSPLVHLCKLWWSSTLTWQYPCPHWGKRCEQKWWKWWSKLPHLAHPFAWIVAWLPGSIWIESLVPASPHNFWNLEVAYSRVISDYKRRTSMSPWQIFWYSRFTLVAPVARLRNASTSCRDAVRIWGAVPVPNRPCNHLRTSIKMAWLGAIAWQVYSGWWWQIELNPLMLNSD